MQASEGTYLSLAETNHMTETQVGLTINPLLSLRLFSTRCREAQTQELRNQDYALATLLEDGSRLCFCVCDGVGSSYQGDFAARYLGQHLVQWLQALPAQDWSAPELAADLHTQLLNWVAQAQAELCEYPIPLETPELLREVLENLRETYGSETVFFGGCITLAAPDSETPATAFFCWMGNVLAHLWFADTTSATLGGPLESADGWSTGRGLRGKVQVRVLAQADFHQLFIHTDGLASIGPALRELDEAALQSQARHLLTLPQNDDMTMLAFQWSELPFQEERSD